MARMRSRTKRFRVSDLVETYWPIMLGDIATFVLAIVCFKDTLAHGSSTTPASHTWLDDNVSIDDPHSILAPVGTTALKCKFRCGNSIGRKDKAIIAGLRSSTLEQNPFCPGFEQNLRDYVTWHICSGAGHRHKFSSEHPAASFLHEALKGLVQQLKQKFRLCFVRENWWIHQYNDDHFMAQAKVPAAYVTQLDQSVTAFEVGSIIETNLPRPCSMYRDIVMQLTKRELQSGYIYFLEAYPLISATENGESLIKIGFTTHAMQRAGQIENTCDLEVINHRTWPTRFAERIEGLIHGELCIRGLQRPFKCFGRRCNSTKHREWFELDCEAAAVIIQYYVDWVSKHEPYDDHGAFNPACMRKLAGTDSDFLLNSQGNLWHRPYQIGSENQGQASSVCTCTKVSMCTKRRPLIASRSGLPRDTSGRPQGRLPVTVEDGVVEQRQAVSTRASHLPRTPAKGSRLATDSAAGPARGSSSRSQLPETPASRTRLSSASHNYAGEANQTPSPLSASSSTNSVSHDLDSAESPSCPATPTPPEASQAFSSQSTWQEFFDFPEDEMDVEFEDHSGPDFQQAFPFAQATKDTGDDSEMSQATPLISNATRVIAGSRQNIFGPSSLEVSHDGHPSTRSTFVPSHDLSSRRSACKRRRSF